MEIVLPKKIESEELESDYYSRKRGEHEREHEKRNESEEDSAEEEEEERSRRTASSASVELDRRCCIVLFCILHSHP